MHVNARIKMDYIDNFYCIIGHMSFVFVLCQCITPESAFVLWIYSELSCSIKTTVNINIDALKMYIY